MGKLLASKGNVKNLLIYRKAELLYDMTYYFSLPFPACTIYTDYFLKGLEKEDGVWGRGKEPFLKRFFPLPQNAIRYFSAKRRSPRENVRHAFRRAQKIITI